MAPIPDERWQPIRDHVGRGLSDEEWVEAKQRFAIGSLVEETVLAHLPMGVWITLGERLAGQIEVVSIIDEQRPLTASEWPAVGAVVQARVLDHHPDGQRIRLSMKPSVLAQR